MAKGNPVAVATVPLPTGIIEVRGVKVLLDADLAEFYAASTKVLNQAIKRNRQKLPPDFMFRLTKDEKAEVVTNCDHLQRLKFSHSLPLAFTKHGALMAANVLSSKAVAMSVFIIRAFMSQPLEAHTKSIHQQVLQFSGAGDWTTEKLIAWLDRHIEHKDIPAGESAEFLRKVIRGLMAKFGITDVSVLALDRFRLKDEVERRIDQHRATEHKAAFQMYLLPDSGLTVTNERGINFKTMGYEPSWLYEGAFQFRKHYFGAKPGELRERTPSGDPTEEFQCAQFLDNLPDVKFWLRNLARKSSSFYLQTSTDRFYPDFICQLQDGRMLVVEYKGKFLYDNVDSEEKRAVGAVWASRSGGKCLFEMPTDGDISALTNVLRA
jgi:hypothetical protein